MTFDPTEWSPDHLATLHGAATEGPWGAGNNWVYVEDESYRRESPMRIANVLSGHPTAAANAALIVFLRNHVDAILDQAAELATLRARVEEALEMMGCNLSEAAVALCVAENQGCSCWPLITALAASTPDRDSQNL